ncbi:DNA-directed RNA polymerase subunit L [Candidatus Woesearchaeota archaeon]|nr:DNA-directed RNA polymerase subunit L [Candidatus Woesearchaeota archaeon]
MKIKIIENKKNKLVLEIYNETHTLFNALKKELWNDDHIKAAGYQIDHPLTGIPKFTVETDGKEEPKKALLAAAARLKKNTDKFKESFLKGVK